MLHESFFATNHFSNQSQDTDNDGFARLLKVPSKLIHEEATVLNKRQGNREIAVG